MPSFRGRRCSDDGCRTGVARMERSGMRERVAPDFASLHPGYKLSLQQKTLRRPAPFPLRALQLGPVVVVLRIAEAEIADEDPIFGNVEDLADAGRIEDRHPLEPDALGAR